MKPSVAWLFRAHEDRNDQTRKQEKQMNQNVRVLFKQPWLFAGSIIGAVLCLILGIYYAVPGIYHVSLGHSHPPLDPKLDYTAGFFVLAVICAGIAGLSRRIARTKGRAAS
jgi:hypothetical protein